MNVNLTAELEKLIREKVESGLYNNQSEVVREALRLLVDQDRFREAHRARLQMALDEGLRQADRGELVEGAGVIEEMRAFLKERRSSIKKD